MLITLSACISPHTHEAGSWRPSCIFDNRFRTGNVEEQTTFSTSCLCSQDGRRLTRGNLNASYINTTT